MSWFEVDRVGLGRQAEQHCKGRLIGELVQNALDEEGVTQINVMVTPIPGRPLAEVIVEDDSPEGFRDLAHAYTLFADSYKRGNPEQRGQFNLGEKMVLAICESASISTTKGTVLFTSEGRVDKPRQKRECGSVFQGMLKLIREEYPQVCDYLRSLLLPERPQVLFNGDKLLPRTAIRTFEASLETVLADEQGVMRPRTRKTRVDVHEALPGETPGLYEMGLPVVETGDRWHVNIHQKVPLNRDRDNVKPSYLRAVRTLVLNEMHEQLTTEDANQVWVRQASSDEDCSEESIKKVLDLRFGEKRAAYDPTDQEANKNWVAQGGTLVYGSMMNSQEWKNAKGAGAIVPTGQLCPTAKPYSTDPNAQPANVIPKEKWTEGMKKMAEYATFLARKLMDISLSISFVHTTNNFAACYGNGQLDFNVFRLGHKWFEQGICEDVDRLLLHEFGHQYSGDHLSENYHKALCKLGAKLKRLALDKPEAFR